MKEKLKSLLAEDTVFYAGLLLLVGIASFGLGRQSVIETKQTAISKPQPLEEIRPLVATEEPLAAGSSNTTVVVASKSGSRYHLPDCPGAGQIKPSNLITFPSITAAESAGYTPAANCDFN